MSESKELFSLTREELSIIAKISSRLDSSYTLSIKNYLDGYQINWANRENSYMWRSCAWDREVVELHNPKKFGDITQIYDINHI